MPRLQRLGVQSPRAAGRFVCRLCTGSFAPPRQRTPVPGAEGTWRREKTSLSSTSLPLETSLPPIDGPSTKY